MATFVGCLISKGQRPTDSETQVIQWLASQSHGIPLVHIQRALAADLSACEVLESIQSLWGRSLLEIEPDGFQLHRSLRGYLDRNF
ncbi:hypothetical protein [Lyngbya confervoides]|uniref:DprA winged helix domain-containing protein n=1 Tax=Lyngbya confervoides BDU141951 TaxID=1574623 RepID=A0ABD4TAZ4_9CYAN|nr:hypothetical protein [Lyngbya confervoides]MCM1985250.1 hypothetical protein [Lyngbya confervoides BDU141951]